MSPEPHQPSIRPATLRVAVVSDAAPGRNGVGAYYQDLLEQLSPQLERVALFSPRVEGGRWRAGLALPLPGDRTQKLCIPNPWSLRRALRELAPHVIIVATPGPYGLFGVRLAQSLGIPVLAGFHTAFEQLTALYWQGSWRGRLVHELFDRSHRYLFARAHSVLGNSQDMLQLAERMGAASTGLIGTPICAEFSATPRRPYGGQLRRVLFAGRLAAEKNLEAVIEAARVHRDIVFSIAGDGPEQRSLARAAKAYRNLRLLGWLDRQALRAEVDHHDVLLLPSHFESFGTIALEAMARERLVVVSAGCGITQWPELRPGLTLIAPEHSAANALTELRAQTPAQRRERARSAATVADALNQRCVAHWCELLTHTVTQSASQVQAPSARAPALE